MHIDTHFGTFGNPASGAALRTLFQLLAMGPPQLRQEQNVSSDAIRSPQFSIRIRSALKVAGKILRLGAPAGGATDDAEAEEGNAAAPRLC